MNSRKAPPPVEQYDISPLLINNFIASKVSPPPARLKAEDAATALAKARVPSEKLSFSKTPIGPFQIICLAFAINSNESLSMH